MPRSRRGMSRRTVDKLMSQYEILGNLEELMHKNKTEQTLMCLLRT